MNNSLSILVSILLFISFIGIVFIISNWVGSIVPCDKMENFPVTIVPTRCFREYWTLETKDGLIMRFSGGNLSQ